MKQISGLGDADQTVDDVFDGLADDVVTGCQQGFRVCRSHFHVPGGQIADVRRADNKQQCFSIADDLQAVVRQPSNLNGCSFGGFGRKLAPGAMARASLWITDP